VVDEVAMMVPEEYGEAGFSDIVLARRGMQGEGQGAFTTINPNHSAYLPLHYVIFFPRGELRWHWGRQLQSLNQQRRRERMPQRAFYRYRLHLREGEADTLFRGKSLTQQFVVDAWAVCDQNKLSWLRSHQQSFRADLYNGLADVLLREDIDLNSVGRKVILPSSFVGGIGLCTNYIRTAWPL